QQAGAIAALAQNLVNVEHLILLGQGIHFPIALEGALKFKETCYLHAEGYRSGEFMHGPIALLDEKIPVIAIAPPTATDPKILPAIRKIKARGSALIGVNATQVEGSTAIFDHDVQVPKVDEDLAPLLPVLPLQLLAYHISKQRGLDVDHPRGLSKSISVENSVS
ncbi:MAG: SIS domain-containing protein, partial [Leptolyngbyaceae bacterium]|nr:SIS domain-containing protein [Leptolyngbyaceae bacterium]